MLPKINANFPKVWFTYIKLREIFERLTFILREFAAIQASQHTYLKEKKAALP